MKFTTLTFASLPLISIALGAAVPQDDSAASPAVMPYPIVPATFIGEVDGHKYELNGTIQDVQAQLKEQFPGINLNNQVVKDNATLEADAAKTSAALVSRAKIWPPLCFPRSNKEWPSILLDDAVYSASVLERTSGQVRVDSHTCVRIFCDQRVYSYAVFLCNDRPDTITPNIAYMGGYVRDSSTYCKRLNDDWWFPRYITKAQFFDTDGYNVITRGLTQRSGSTPSCKCTDC